MNGPVFSSLSSASLSSTSFPPAPAAAGEAGGLPGHGLYEVAAGPALRGEVEPQARGLSVADHAQRVVSHLVGEPGLLG